MQGGPLQGVSSSNEIMRRLFLLIPLLLLITSLAIGQPCVTPPCPPPDPESPVPYLLIPLLLSIGLFVGIKNIAKKKRKDKMRKKLVKRLFNRLTILPRWIIIVIDLFIISVATYLGYVLRFNLNFDEVNGFRSGPRNCSREQPD